jgi:hypothetical protein
MGFTDYIWGKKKYSVEYTSIIPQREAINALAYHRVSNVGNLNGKKES